MPGGECTIGRIYEPPFFEKVLIEARCRALHLRGRRVKFSQRDVARALRIALTGLRNIYDLVGEHFIDKVAAIRESKRYQRHFVCEPHDPDRLGIELVAIEVGADRHVHLPAYRRECYRLSVTDAWADAAADDNLPIPILLCRLSGNRRTGGQQTGQPMGLLPEVPFVGSIHMRFIAQSSVADGLRLSRICSVWWKACGRCW